MTRRPVKYMFPEFCTAHTTARDFKSNGRAPCEKKFSFLPNSAYSFTVHAGSYHSVDGVGKAVGLRKSVLVNWYDQDIGRPGTG